MDLIFLLKYFWRPTLNKIKENKAIKIDGSKVEVEKKIKYLKLVSDPSFLVLLSFKILYVLKIIDPKNNIKSIMSIISNILRLKSFNWIKLRLIKVKNVNNPNTIQTNDDVITHLLFLMI